MYDVCQWLKGVGKREENRIGEKREGDASIGTRFLFLQLLQRPYKFLVCLSCMGK